ncbi:hypothetical protein PENTCL1PPCAC_517, partial [Pristionchus entomophagus]
EHGLYENCDPKYNKTIDRNGSFVIATNNFPTGARFWFPCFDEFQRKTTFDLRVSHPKALNVYSNTDIHRTENHLDSNRINSIFAKTSPMSTYQLVLSVNQFPVDNLGKLHGFKRVRIISSLNNPEVNLKEIQRNLITANLDHLKNVSSTLCEQLSGNLDIIFLDGTFLFTVNPGLITIGRYNYFRDPETEKKR